MNKILLLLCLLLTLSNCGSKEDVPGENVETFSDEYFKRYEGNILYNEDSELLLDESILVVGNGKEENDIYRKPFILEIGVDKELTKLNF